MLNLGRTKVSLKIDLFSFLDDDNDTCVREQQQRETPESREDTRIPCSRSHGDGP
jgi:hypothetical protein